MDSRSRRRQSLTTNGRFLETREDDAEMRAINEMLVITSVRHQESAEVALRAEQRLRDLVHDLNAVICEVGIPNGELTFLNLKSDRFLDRPVEHWRSQTSFLTEIIHPSDRKRVEKLLPTLINNRKNYEYDFRAISADTDLIWM